MLIMTAIAPVVLHFGFGVDFLTAALYSNVVGFIIAPMLVVAIMRKDLQEERQNAPISIGRVIGWTAVGVLLAWTTQIVAVTIEMDFLGINPSSEKDRKSIRMNCSNVTISY